MDDKELNSEPREVKISKEVSGLTINLSGQASGMSVNGVSGAIEGPQGLFHIDISLAKDGEGFIINGKGNFTKEPLQGAISATVQTDSSFKPDMSTLQTEGQAIIDSEISGVKINLSGGVENGRLSSLSGTIEGLGGSYIINASIVDNGDGYTIAGSGNLSAGPISGTAKAEILTDDSFNIDPSSLNISGQANVEKEISGVNIKLNGVLENGRLASLAGTVEGLGGSYLISASVVDNGNGYTITGSGDFAAGPIQGTATAQIETGNDFSIDPSSLNISGDASVDKDIGGVHVNLQGSLENGRLASLSGTVEGMGGAYILNAAVADNGEGYTISGSGDFVMGPVQGSVMAAIETDNDFSVDPSSLNISGQIAYDKELASIQISLLGAMENNRFSEFAGTIIAPGDVFTLNVSLVDNGNDYTITGSGAFTAGPVQGDLIGEVLADNNFNIDPSTFLLSGDVNVDSNVAGIQIIMAGSLVDSRLSSLEGNIIGPNNMFDLAVAVVDNGEGYTVMGSGEFTAGPAIGTLVGQVDTDDNFNPLMDTLDVGGDVNVDTNLLGNQIAMAGTMEHMSLQSLIGTIEGPNGLYLLEASVEETCQKRIHSDIN